MNRPVLYDESLIYAKKLKCAISIEGHNKYRVNCYLNFHHKYDFLFKNNEAKIFTENPGRYLEGSGESNGVNYDIHFNEKVIGKKLYLKMLFKVFFHWLFIFIGMGQRIKSKNKRKIESIRKCYVEDIEALFDHGHDCDLRLLYPFPLSLKRQFLYAKFLKNNNKVFHFDGFRYGAVDFLRFLFFPIYKNLMILEVRSAIRTALIHVKLFDIKLVQSSDEYDVGAVFYTKIMRRKGVLSHNSAHGVGKYLPYTDYDIFDCLTNAQIDYYFFFNSKREYNKRVLSGNVQTLSYKVDKPTIVFIGQNIGHDLIIKNSEDAIFSILKRLSEQFLNKVDFIYKPHPNLNQENSNSINEMILLSRGLVYGNPELIVQFSFFSTCYIDPNFVGEKFLVQTESIRPSICFGENEMIVNIKDLEEHLLNLITKMMKTNGD